LLIKSIFILKIIEETVEKEALKEKKLKSYLNPVVIQTHSE
jgi:hypothetical protein